MPTATRCWKCGSLLFRRAAQPPQAPAKATATPRQQAPIPAPVSLARRPGELRKVLAVLVAIAGVLLVLTTALILGSFHIVSSSRQGIFLIRKVHFTYSETFVSMDAIISQPYIVAIAMHPLAIAALQRDGYLETDEQREERIHQESRY